MSVHHPHLATTTAAAMAINAIREQLGKSRVASEWSRLTIQQRAMLCYGAKLRPSTYADMAMEDMTEAEREQIRAALVEMKKGVQAITTTEPTEWRRAAAHQASHRQTQQQAERTEQRNRMKLNQQARQLSSRLNTINAKSPVSSN